MVDLFGDRSRWGQTMQPMQLAFLTQVLPGFTGELRLRPDACRCSYDVDVAAHKYLAALEDGEVPLLLLFSGTVFTGAPGSIAVQPVPWHKETAGPDAGGGLARGDGRPLPGPGLAAPRAGDDVRPARRLPRPARAGRLGRRARRGCSSEAGDDRDRPRSSAPGPWPTPCSTRATCSTPTAPARRRTRCAGSGAC